MDSTDFYCSIARDLKEAGLSEGQVEEALIARAEDSHVQIIKAAIKKAWIPEGMIPSPKSGFDFDAGSSYQSRVEQVNEAPPEVYEDEVDGENAKRNQLVKLITETAELADKRGFTKQANFLDGLLIDLV